MTPSDPVPTPVAAPDVPGDPFIRLARLRAEYAGRYPGLDAGAWYPAASVAEYYRSWLTRHPDPSHVGVPLRGLDTAHFELSRRRAARGAVDPGPLAGRPPRPRMSAR